MATTKQRGPGAPRREDSRPGLIRAIKARQTHTDTVIVESLGQISAAKKRLHQVWSRAITAVRADFPNRTFTCSSTADVQDGVIVVGLTVKRTA